MAASSKIRVGFIGLNAPYTGAPTGTSWAAQAHLPYLRTSSKYEIVALQNSSAERAAKAIEAYGFDPEKVKAYGTPEDLANDPNVDLVVSSIRVDRHANSLIPSIKANKDVFVEWPIEASYEKAKELTDLIRAHNVRNVVGLQGGYAAVATRVKSMIDNGEIGKMESSTFIGKARGGGIVSQHVDYFVDRMVGGNLFTIGFGHAMEFITKGGSLQFRILEPAVTTRPSPIKHVETDEPIIHQSSAP
ncbi:MAG: hypothetical protein LQ350_007254 [Teloschistes chrysophthalmus]|nr:MAG: hypothetical protein LQ350_007254 [Niorma chrysophthalma]